MRKIYTLFMLVAVCVSISANSQTFTDNFDSYTAGSYLCVSSTAWKTWSGAAGGTADIRISNAKAKSGNNSLHFMSTGSGGPSDVVLPFGGKYNKGKFSISLSLFVDMAKKAYFNLQEDTLVGKGWSVDVNFDSLGNVNLVNTLSGNVLKTTYTQAQWLKVELKLDLSANNWEFLIDDVSKGVFQNGYRQVASMDVYPLAGSSFYVDDVTYTYTPHVLPTLDATVTYIDKISGALAGMSVLPTVEIRNLGTQTITSAVVELNYNGTTQTKTVSGINVASLATYLITWDNTIALVAGAKQVTATVKQVNGQNDDDATNNSKILNINPVVPAINKLVIAEEATGTWCTWCPRGAVWLKRMDEKYHGLIQGIAVHNNDTMMYSIYDKGLGTISSGYPSMVVDRGTDIDPSGMEPDFLARIVVAPKAVIRNGAQYNSSTGELKVSLTTRFLQPASGNYKVACVIIEDSVTGTGTKFNQINAYAGGANGVMGGFELLPNPVPASMMVYEHVARVISPNFTGVPNAYAATVNAGDSFTHNFVFTLYGAWKPAKMKIVGMVIEPGGRIDNGSSATIAEATANGYTNGTLVQGVQTFASPNAQVVVYPNPSKSIFNIVLNDELIKGGELQVFNIQGKLVHSAVVETGASITIDAQGWQSGIYLVQIKHEGGLMKVKLVKE